MKCVGSVVDDNQRDTCHYTVNTKKLKSFFLKESNKAFNGQHGYDESNNTAQHQEFYILLHIGPGKVAMFIEIVKIFQGCAEHGWYRQEKGELCSGGTA